jgi:hypothetical protein
MSQESGDDPMGIRQDDVYLGGAVAPILKTALRRREPFGGVGRASDMREVR